MPPTVNEMKDIVVRLYDETNRLNLDIFDELLAPNFVSYGGAAFQDVYGPGAFKSTYQAFVTSMPDLQICVEQMVAEGSEIAVRGRMSGTHKEDFMGMAPPTGRKIVWTGTAIFGFDENGLSNARWQEWDGLQVMQQMGVIPTAPGGDAAPPPTPLPPIVTGTATTSPSQNRAAVIRFFDEVWNKGNLDVADELFHPEASCPSAPMLPRGAAAVRIIAGMFRGAMADYATSIKKILADGDYVLVWFSQSGTQSGELMGIPATGKRAEWNEMALLRFGGGKVVESWYNTDMLGLMQQLGVSGSNGGGGKG